MTHTERLLQLRSRPSGQPLMRQTWSNLTFLHWKFEPEAIQKLLPAGLTVDTYHGDGYVGLVPFQMRNIRHRTGLWVPTAHNFLETNVRTYVVDETGSPGVWFFSLDANSRLAVWGGRTLYGLPYHRSTMMFFEQDRLRYDMIRVADGLESTVFSSQPSEVSEPAPGSLEFWLVERYQLFSFHKGQLESGRVWHEPYRIAPCETECESYGPVVDAGFQPGQQPPITHFSPGVDVEVWPLRSV